MNTYRYHLDNKKPRKKYACPSCGKTKVFTKYLDNQTGNYLPDDYGICERVNNCGYSLNPYKDGYSKRVWEGENNENSFVCRPTFNTSATRLQAIKVVHDQKTLYPIPLSILSGTLGNWQANDFVKRLSQIVGEKIVIKKIRTYYLGTSDLTWSGSTTLPFISIDHKIRSIQVKKFDTSLHTSKYTTNSGENRSCTTWLHSEVEHQSLKRNEVIPLWVKDYNKNEIKVSCFFGEHLLNLPGNKAKPVAIVEAPKTAVIASIYYDKILGDMNFIWLAAGALGYLTKEKCNVLRGRNVTLFPDLNAYDKWKVKADELSNIATFYISDLLERKASNSDKLKGLDIADYLLRINYKNFQPLSTSTKTDTVLNSEQVLVIQGDILSLRETQTGAKFNNIIIAQIVFDTGKEYEILYPDTEDALPIAEINETVISLGLFNDKIFVKAMHDGIPCLAFEIY